MEPCPPASRHTDSAATCSLCAFGRRPGWSRVQQAPTWQLELVPVLALASLQAWFPSSSVLLEKVVADCTLPKPLPTGRLRSLRTSHCFNRGPDSGMRLPGWASATLPGFRRRKVFQFYFTLLAIHTFLSMGTVPKTAAPFANFQLHAQFHDDFSIFSSYPVGFSCCWLFRGVERARQGNSGFSCPDEGLPPSLSCFLSCS